MAGYKYAEEFYSADSFRDSVDLACLQICPEDHADKSLQYFLPETNSRYVEALAGGVGVLWLLFRCSGEAAHPRWQAVANVSADNRLTFLPESAWLIELFQSRGIIS